MTRLATILAVLALTTTSTHAQLPSLLPPPPGNPQCAGLARGLTTGACSAAVTALRASADTIASATCPQLAALPAASTITPACCADAKAFIAAGCGCDTAVTGLISAAGVNAGVLAGGVRLVQVACGTAANPILAGSCKGIETCAPVK